MRFLVGLLFFAFSFVPVHADPADYSRIVSFGDSLSDNGNLHNAIGLPTSPPYFFGRFSNGPTWAEILAGPGGPALGQSSQGFFGSTIGSVNYAFGGATAASLTDNVLAGFLNPALYSSEPLIPSVITQIGAFSSTFGPKDLVTVQGGANDLFNFFNANLANPALTQSAIQQFAGAIGGLEGRNVGALIGLGAQTILVGNLPNIGATPNFNGSLSTQQAGTLATVTYNAALGQATQALAAANPKVNLIQMDWFSALNVILANQAAFGFTNVTGQCILNPVTCNGTNFLFWDGVHPTEAGHILLARYADLLLSTEQTGKAVGQLGQVSLLSRLDNSDILFRRGAAPGAVRPGGIYAELIGTTGSVDGVSGRTYTNNTGVDYSTGGVRAGFDATYGFASFGTALSYQEGTLSGSALSSNIKSTAGDAYLMMRYSVFFAGLEGGIALNEYNHMNRRTGFPTVNASGNTSSLDYSGAATVGSQYQMGGFTLTPAARVGYASVNVGSFQETAPILALQYGDRDLTTGFYTVRVRAASQLNQGRATVFAEVGYEDLFSTDAAYTAKLANNTAHAVTINDDLNGRGVFFKAGVGGYITENIKVSGEYGLSLQNGNGDVHSGRLQLTIPLNGPQ